MRNHALEQASFQCFCRKCLGTPVAVRSSVGRAFHAAGPHTLNARRPRTILSADCPGCHWQRNAVVVSWPMMTQIPVHSRCWVSAERLRCLYAGDYQWTWDEASRRGGGRHQRQQLFPPVFSSATCLPSRWSLSPRHGPIRVPLCARLRRISLRTQYVRRVGLAFSVYLLH